MRPPLQNATTNHTTGLPWDDLTEDTRPLYALVASAEFRDTASIQTLPTTYTHLEAAARAKWRRPQEDDMKRDCCGKEDTPHVIT